MSQNRMLPIITHADDNLVEAFRGISAAKPFKSCWFDGTAFLLLVLVLRERAVESDENIGEYEALLVERFNTVVVHACDNVEAIPVCSRRPLEIHYLGLEFFLEVLNHCVDCFGMVICSRSVVENISWEYTMNTPIFGGGYERTATGRPYTTPCSDASQWRIWKLSVASSSCLTTAIS